MSRGTMLHILILEFHLRTPLTYADRLALSDLLRLEFFFTPESHTGGE